MPSPSAAQQKFPDWLRWSALFWLVAWFVVYWRIWGPANFLHLCDIAVVLTCLSLWTNNVLLISSQAVSSLMVDLAWALDAGWTLLFRRHLIGGTEYLFDAHYPLWARLISLFHMVLPVLLIWALYRAGYDRRGWLLQSAIAAIALISARFAAPSENINFAFRDPFFHRAWGPAPIHLALSILFLAIVVYLPTHLILRRLFSAPVRT